MSTLMELARKASLRAVRAYGKEDTFLVWCGRRRVNQMDPLEVWMTEPDSCTCEDRNLRGNCIHMGFVRELIARDISARNPVWIEDVKRIQAPPKWPADGRTISPYHGVSWCPFVGRWKTSIMVAGRHCVVGRFDDEIDAARAYDWATYYRKDRDTRRMGKRPRYNFPDQLPPVTPAGIRPGSPIWRVLDLDQEVQAA